MTAASPEAAARDHASTPTAVGYGVALVVSWVLVTVTSGIWLLVEESFGSSYADDTDLTFGFGDLVVGALDWAFLVLAVGVVTGPLGAFLVHLVCRGVAAQWVHVLVSFTVGAVAGVVVATVLELDSAGDTTLTTLGVGACVALGRAAVIPSVPAVIASYPPGTPWWRRFRLR